ncbi:anthrone oxygenase family protein [Parapedobacter koreensis]|uniref:Uncharacterized membrane protein n=1 Tax=Parapedobacter koreensis TaxID=332977 RepID=A0A1H7F5M9_9SPHI|nr:anthrone oxygenase family protein [Parapedobacter koreensis]SEK18465.1 Uncharacterized membrane protein [Parapedobacter koreensis]
MVLQLALLLAILATGLISGFFYAYSCSVNTGLGRLNDAVYLKAMQSINRAVLNPLFFLTFFGTLVLLPVVTWLEFRLVGTTNTFYGLLVSSLLYFFGVFLVTAMGNVPLNDALAQFDIEAATEADIRQQRLAFEGPWNRFHLIRSVFNALAFAGAVWAGLQA